MNLLFNVAKQTIKVTNSNGHPSLIGHKYRSTVIEHFLRSL